MSLPTSISGIESGELNALYYARRNGTLARLVAQKAGPEDPKNPKYKVERIELKSEVVDTAIPHISTVAYTQGGKQVRIYYIGYSDKGNKFQLKELCQTDNGPWFDGALNHKKHYISKDSRISAVVAEQQKHLNVFYLDEDETLNVAWVTLGQEAWSNREVYDGKF
ncbi:uncharacterized protein N7496_007645 [Penicillium cataractarum]|uniref:Fucose-specific lectin n=1 Tax=Penicillium cataractarum TaxID=2100454 RepID=A0A9W9V668_9EURO|nr:uncharacterized protein N7496_007645 [Penicillium cataractarum]KAJ5367885.1 hypothetical protein N7496_007645 [Penicillium cataractarum]